MRSRTPRTIAFAVIACAACGRVADSTALTRTVDGSGGVVTGADAEIAAGGTSGGGEPAAGGVSASGGASGGGLPCPSRTDTCPPSFDDHGTELAPCCTPADECGFDTTTLHGVRDVAVGCQALGEPGAWSASCPFHGCCRFDGTCGADLSLEGLGCVHPGTASAEQPCQIAGPCRFVLQMTTVTAKGIYSPHNVGAVWIETASGQFVRTLVVWGETHVSAAVAWVRSGGTWVDTLTGASRTDQGPLQAAWDCTDASGAVVTDGRYQVCMTFEEDPLAQFTDVAPAAYLCVPFERRQAPFDLLPPGDAHFRDIHMTMH